MLLSRALRIHGKDVVTLTGGGGKTTLMFRLAGELTAAGRLVVTTLTTRISVSEMAMAPTCLLLQDEEALLGHLPGCARHLPARAGRRGRGCGGG